MAGVDGSIFLQKQIRDNSDDLRSYLKDLTIWEEDMKRKESELNSDIAEKKPRQKVTKTVTKPAGKQPKRIKSSDYAAWDKFDVEAACEKLDADKHETSSDEDPTEEALHLLRDEAVREKEKGNQFVKEKKWDYAIACYTHAISCDPKDPIFYANRALCFLKKNELHSAEADCTSALKLDPKYVKALQRRAAARIDLKQPREALDDLEQVLELEPHNLESKKELDKIQKQLGIKKVIKSDESKSIPGPSNSVSVSTDDMTVKENKIKPEKCAIPWRDYQNAVPLNSVNKPPHLRSKKPLRRIEVIESDDIVEETMAVVKNELLKPVVTKPVTNYQGNSLAQILSEVSTVETKIDEIIENKVVVKDDTLIEGKQEFKPPEKQNISLVEILSETSKFEVMDDSADKRQKIATNVRTTKNDHINSKSIKRHGVSVVQSEPEKPLPINTTENVSGDAAHKLSIPKTSVQFNYTWKLMKNDKNQKYSYLKQIQPNQLPNIFQECLEANVFTDIIDVLNEKFTNDNLEVFPYLKALSKVKRFSTLTMFMSKQEKSVVRELIKYCQLQGVDEDDIKSLSKSYEV